MWTRERLGYLVLGVSIGGLVDGVVLHQVLQWHHLWSARRDDSTVDGLEANTLLDGIFHLATLGVLALALALLVGRRLDRRPLVGLGLVGWGLFHVVDQLLFHLALEAHHIRMGVENEALYDWGFFAIGLVLIAVGATLLRVRASAAAAS
jgi:uncharacterized membrane protein